VGGRGYLSEDARVRTCLLQCCVDILRHDSKNRLKLGRSHRKVATLGGANETGMFLVFFSKNTHINKKLELKAQKVKHRSLRFPSKKILLCAHEPLVSLLGCSRFLVDTCSLLDPVFQVICATIRHQPYRAHRQ